MIVKDAACLKGQMPKIVCRSWEGKPFLPVETSKFLQPVKGEICHPCGHIPAARTWGIRGFLFSFCLGKGSRRAWRRGPLLLGFLRRPRPLSSPCPSRLCFPGAEKLTPTRAWLVLLRDGCQPGGGKNAGCMSSGTMGSLFGNFLHLRVLASRIS